MGPRAIIIPESIVMNLQEILRANGIDVERITIDETYFQGLPIPNFKLDCSIPDGDSVTLSFSRPNFDPKLLLIVLQAKSTSWWKIFAKNRLFPRIVLILKENGATDLPPRPTKESI